MIFVLDWFGIITVFVVYFTVAIQIFAVFYVGLTQFSLNYLLLKWIFYLIALWFFVAHLKCMLTDPGRMDHQNNPDILEFYYLTRKSAIACAEMHNKLLDGKVDLKLETMESEESEESETFENRTSISDAQMEQYGNIYKLALDRCKNCSVARPRKAHHCRICRSFMNN